MKAFTTKALQDHIHQLKNLAIAKKQYEDRANKEIEEFSAAAATVVSYMGMNPKYDSFLEQQAEISANIAARRDAKNKWFDELEAKMQAEFLASLQD